MSMLVRLACLLLATLVLPTRAQAETTQCTNIASLPTVIATQGVYCLKQDLATAITSGNAITIATNNVTLDCNDHKIGGLQAGTSTLAVGIGYGSVAGSVSNLTIRHCNIRGFAYGIQMNGYFGNVVDNRLDNNYFAAMALYGGNHYVARNLINDTGGHALYGNRATGMLVASHSVISENIINGIIANLGSSASVMGIYAFGGGGTTIIDNQISDLAPRGSGQADGILSEADYRNVIQGNRLLNTSVLSGTGIYAGGSKAVCKDNVIMGFTITVAYCRSFGTISD